MSVMDVLPTLTAAAGIEADTTFALDGKNMLPAIVDGVEMPRQDLLFFISETPIRNQHKITAFNGEWKLVQEMKAGLSSVEITNYLFRIDEDPYEYNNLAEQHPKIVAKLAKEIHHWRALYPVSGTRSELVPPPGWHAPKDWADYPRPMEQLQENPSRGIPPARALKPLDWQYGEAGRLIYNCEPYKWAGGGLCK